MAKLQPLKLSDLRSGVDYPVGTQVQERRCLFHVKLTDFSMRSIESLITSDKGAFFSLWFADGGGTISIPGTKEDRKFNFKTSQGDNDGFECVHQAVEPVNKQPQLNCWGQIRYKLQVQGTKEVYERTKKLMKETEEQKQKTRTQTINFPHSKAGRSKSGVHPGRSGGGRPLIKTSSPSLPSSSSHSSTSTSAPPTSSVSGSSFNTKLSAASGTAGSSGSTGGKTPGSGRKSSKPPHTLRERIIHLLAVKPQKRADIITRLKKETKRGENAMSKSDSLLQEVADIQGDVYHLKQSLYSELRVDDWPFYSDVERQLVKRRHGSGEQINEFLKRPAVSSREFPPPPKRQKLAHSTPPPPPQTHNLTQITERHSPPLPPKHDNYSTHQLNMPRMDGSSNSANPSNIEILSSSSSLTNVISTATHTSSHSSAQKPQAQYPGSILSNFIRASSSASSTSAPAFSVLPTTSSQSQQTSLRPGGQTGLSTAAATASRTGSSGTTGEGGGIPAPSGSLFGDLVASVSDQPLAEVASSLKKKEKKKKKKNRNKEKFPEDSIKISCESHPSVVPVVETAANGGDVKVKSEDERSDRGGVGVDVKSEEGRSGGGRGDEKVVKSETVTEENGASSTTPSTVDFSLKYPPITSDATRAEYKGLFNEEYQEYLALKGQIEVVTNEVTALSEQMAAVKKGTEEAKILRRKIREKYTELQQNKKYQFQKRRFQELHVKLGHIKRQVVEYDKGH